MSILKIFFGIFINLPFYAHANELENVFKKIQCYKLITSSAKNEKQKPLLQSCYNSQKDLIGRLYSDSKDYNELFIVKNLRLEFYKLDHNQLVHLYKWGEINHKENLIHYHYSNGDHQKVPFFQEAALCSVNPNKALSEARKFLNQNLEAQSQQQMKFLISPACENYVANNFPKLGIQKGDFSSYFQKTAEASIKKGIQCLSQLKGPRVQQDLAQIEELLFSGLHEVKISCEKIKDEWQAAAYLCNTPQWPALSFAQFPITENTLFHEIFHLLDPRNYHFNHDEHDRTISCETCCFGSASYISSLDTKFHCAICEDPNKISKESYLLKMLEEARSIDLEIFIFDQLQEQSKNPDWVKSKFAKTIAPIIYEKHPNWQMYKWNPELKKIILNLEKKHFSDLEREYQGKIRELESTLKIMDKTKNSTKSKNSKILADKTIASTKTQIEAQKQQIALLAHCSRLRENFPLFLRSTTKENNTSSGNRYDQYSKENGLPPPEKWKKCFQRL